jgi:hypothetical protein
MCGSSSRVSALQAKSPEFKPKFHWKKKKSDNGVHLMKLFQGLKHFYMRIISFYWLHNYQYYLQENQTSQCFHFQTFYWWMCIDNHSHQWFGKTSLPPSALSLFKVSCKLILALPPQNQKQVGPLARRPCRAFYCSELAPIPTDKTWCLLLRPTKGNWDLSGFPNLPIMTMEIAGWITMT